MEEKNTEQERNKNQQMLLTLAAALLPMFISDMIPERMPRIIFIVCLILAGVTLTEFHSQSGIWRKAVPVLCVVIVAFILLQSLYTEPTVPKEQDEAEAFVAQEREGEDGQQATSEAEASDGDGEYEQDEQQDGSLPEQDWQGIYENSYEMLADANARIESLITQSQENGLPGGQELEAADSSFLRLAEKVYQYRFWEEKESKKETEEALEYIQARWDELKEEDRTDFDSLGTERDQVELFYKIKLSEGYYFYCNMIRAMEDYGIDCAGMGIDEAMLFCWDVDRLFAIYNMRKALEPRLTEAEPVERWEGDYNEYRAYVSGYGDEFDYKFWNRNFVVLTVSYIVQRQDTVVMNYFLKFNKNFGADLG